MKRVTPPCNSIALLLRSSPPFTMRLTDHKAALAVFVHPGADVPRLHRPGTEHLAEHHPAIRQPVGGGITGHQSAVRPDQHAVQPASDSDVRLLGLLRVPRKSEN